MARTQTPTQRELSEMCEHVGYEAAQVQWTAARLSEMGTKSRERNAMLTAYLAHTRNLLNFLCPPEAKDRRNGDVFAFDYIEGGESAWRHFCSPAQVGKWMGHSVPEVHKAISTRSGHLSLARRKKLRWRVWSIASGLDRAFACFLDAVSPEHRAEIRRHS